MTEITAQESINLKEMQGFLHRGIAATRYSNKGFQTQPLQYLWAPIQALDHESHLSNNFPSEKMSLQVQAIFRTSSDEAMSLQHVFAPVVPLIFSKRPRPVFRRSSLPMSWGFGSDAERKRIRVDLFDHSHHISQPVSHY